MVFVRAVHEKQWMSDLELNIYDSWWAVMRCCHAKESLHVAISAAFGSATGLPGILLYRLMLANCLCKVLPVKHPV